jgi:hypothetical protein
MSLDQQQSAERRQAEPSDMFSFADAEFRYEPYPIGIMRPVMDQALYDELVRSYPPLDLFTHLTKVGHKYVLSEKFNAENYHRFIEETPIWRRLRDWIKSDAFIGAVDVMLRDNFIDVGLSRTDFSTVKKLRRGWRDVRRGHFPRIPPGLRARFEFSMLPADGGYILPHTDTPKKLITLIVSTLAEDEWDPAFGGGTEVNRPRDRRHAYNWLNANVPFEEAERLDTFEFAPNQCIVFVKTFNSLHCVRPMTGKGSTAMRRTLTINIEHDE